MADVKLQPDPADMPVKQLRPTPYWGFAALAAWVGLVVCGYIGTALGTTWANDHPLGLIALHARVRHLLLALGNDLVWWQFALVAGLRLGVAYAICHLLGRVFSDRVLHYSGATKQSINTIEDLFDKVDWIIIPWFAGSNLVAAITGIRKINPLRLATLVSIGIALRLALFWWLSRIFDDELDKVLDFLARYQRPFLIGSIVLVVVAVIFNLRRSQNFSR